MGQFTRTSGSHPVVYSDSVSLTQQLFTIKCTSAHLPISLGRRGKGKEMGECVNWNYLSIFLRKIFIKLHPEAETSKISWNTHPPENARARLQTASSPSPTASQLGFTSPARKILGNIWAVTTERYGQLGTHSHSLIIVQQHCNT